LYKKWTMCTTFKAFGNAAVGNIWSRPWIMNGWADGGHYPDPATWGSTFDAYCKILNRPQDICPTYTFYRLGAQEDKFKSNATKYLMWDSEAGNEMDRGGGTTAPGIYLLNTSGADTTKSPTSIPGGQWAFRHLVPTDKRLYQQNCRGCAMMMDGHVEGLNPNALIWGDDRYHDP